MTSEAAIVVTTTEETTTTIPTTIQPSKRISLVYREGVSPYISHHIKYLQASNIFSEVVTPTSSSKTRKERVLSLVEADGPFYSDTLKTKTSPHRILKHSIERPHTRRATTLDGAPILGSSTSAISRLSIP